MEAVLNAEVRKLGGDEPDGTGGATRQPDATSMLVAEDNEGPDGRLCKRAKFEMDQCRLENRALKRATARASQQLSIRTQQCKMELLAARAALDELKRDHQHLKNANDALEADNAKLRGSIDQLKSKNATLATESKILRKQLQKEVPREARHSSDNNSPLADPAGDNGESRTMEAIDVDGIVDGIPEHGKTCNSKWNDMFREFQRTAAALLVDMEVEEEGNGRLCDWIRDQRNAYWMALAGLDTCRVMSDEKLAKLDEIGFDWGKENIAWFETYSSVSDILTNQGNLVGLEDHPVLGPWLAEQMSHLGKTSQGDLQNMNLPTGCGWISEHRSALLRQIGLLPDDQT